MQDIIRPPWLFRFLQRPLAKLISVLRAPRSKEGYASIGGGSPLRKITDELVECMSSLRIRIQVFFQKTMFWSFCCFLSSTSFMCATASSCWQMHLHFEKIVAGWWDRNGFASQQGFDCQCLCRDALPAGTLSLKKQFIRWDFNLSTNYQILSN